ncbi:MAG: 4Fe-4S binding protein [Acutalibacteraceae bacterium]
MACMKCVKACEYDAIKIENFRAIIDPDKCTACGACVDVCPKDCITLYSSEPRRMQA